MREAFERIGKAINIFWKSKMTKHTSALHISDVKNAHTVAVNDLHVLVVKEGVGWFLQSLEIDYAACGDTLTNAKKNFEAGFNETIHCHLRLNGGIEKFLKVSPQEVWDEYYKLKKDLEVFHYVSAHEVLPEYLHSDFPFSNISYVIKRDEKLAA